MTFIVRTLLRPISPLVVHLKKPALQMKIRQPIVPQVVCVVLLLWAIFGDNPYGYYVLLRWICCPTLAWLAWRAYGLGRVNAAWLLGVAALVYNPVIRVHATRDFWRGVNAITIVLLIASIPWLRAQISRGDEVQQ